MLFTIAAVLLVLWLLGLVSGYTLGNFIYVLLVIALVLFRGRAVHGAADNTLGFASHPASLTREDLARRERVALPVLSAEVRSKTMAETLARFDTPVSDRYGRIVYS